MNDVPRFYVITGGPGSGKTTLLAELARRGYVCIAEDARTVIQEQSLQAVARCHGPMRLVSRSC